MFKEIIDPNTNNIYNINDIEGRQLLKKYVNTFLSGGKRSSNSSSSYKKNKTKKNKSLRSRSRSRSKSRSKSKSPKSKSKFDSDKKEIENILEIKPSYKKAEKNWSDEDDAADDSLIYRYLRILEYLNYKNKGFADKWWESENSGYIEIVYEGWLTNKEMEVLEIFKDKWNDWQEDEIEYILKKFPKK